MALPDHYFLHIIEASTTTGNPTMSFASGWQAAGLGELQTCIVLDASDDSVEFDTSSSSTTSGWVSFLYGVTTAYTTIDDAEFVVLKGATTDLFRIRMDGTGGNWAAEYWNGAAWAAVGSVQTSPLISATGYNKFDIFFNLADSGGEFSVYINGSATAAATFTGDTLTTADTTIDFMYFEHPGTSQNNLLAGFVMDTANTRDLYLAEQTTSLAGTLQEWDVSTEANIDEALYQYADVNTSMANSISHTTASEDATYNYVALPASVDGKTIEGVAVYGTLLGAGANPLAVRSIAYISSTAYESPTAQVQPDNVDGLITKWEYPTDPSTASAWANAAAVEAAQFGFRTKTP